MKRFADIIKLIVVEVDVNGPESCPVACFDISGVESSGSASFRVTKELVVISVCKNNSVFTDCGIYLTRCVLWKGNWVSWIETVSRATNAGGTVYGNWRPQFVPAPELSTSFQETRVKNENTNNETVSVLWSREFQLSVTSLKCVTFVACVSEQERRMAASQVV
jgi:hypothetical protein